MVVPNCLPHSNSRSIAYQLLYSALIIELAGYGVIYVSDTALTASCIATAVACHKYMIAPALDYEPSPVNTALQSTDMAP